jgi:SAM-dependent methyltransferase
MAIISAAAYHSGKFLHENELLDCSQRCPWCGFADPREQVLALQKDPDVHLLQCPRCCAVSSSQVATEPALAAYYGLYYAAGRKARVTCGSPHRHAVHIYRHARPAVERAKISILDFGGGDGSIGQAVALEMLRQREATIDLVIVDYNDRLVTPASSRVTLTHASSLEQIPSGQRFDLVLASAVLEHLAQPAEITRQLLQRLTYGGYFYARTPCVVPLLKLLDRLHLSYDFTFPAHFHDLGQDFWKNIIPTLGLDTREWRVQRSRPSIVETSLTDNFLRTALSYCMKAPWRLLRHRYPYTGGWEVFIQRALRPE